MSKLTSVAFISLIWVCCHYRIVFVFQGWRNHRRLNWQSPRESEETKGCSWVVWARDKGRHLCLLLKLVLFYSGVAVRWVRSFSSVIFEEQSQRKSLCLVLLLFMMTVLSRIKYLVLYLVGKGARVRQSNLLRKWETSLIHTLDFGLHLTLICWFCRSSVNLQRMEPTWSFKTKVTRQRPINWRQLNCGRWRHSSSPLGTSLLAKGWGLFTCI